MRLWGWSGGAMVLGELPVPGCPTIWIRAYCACRRRGGGGGGCLDIYTLLYPFPPLSPSLWETARGGGGCLDIYTLRYPFPPLSPSLWETARYRLKYCLKGPLNPKQPTKQMHIYSVCFSILRMIVAPNV